MYTASIVRPINHFSGFHTFYPGFASGKGAAPFKTLADYENNLKRHAQFLAISDRAIDRSPCGTGTSAKLACLIADGKFGEGQTWRQESILGTQFTGSVRVVADGAVPRIAGSAFVTAESTLILDGADPFRHGIGP